MIISKNQLREIHHEYCSCGGSGPNDKEACVACKIIHEIEASSLEEENEKD